MAMPMVPQKQLPPIQEHQQQEPPIPHRQQQTLKVRFKAQPAQTKGQAILTQRRPVKEQTQMRQQHQTKDKQV
jgi:hypothetical protein